MRTQRRWAFALAVAWLAGGCAEHHGLALPAGAVVVGDPGLSEMSGLEASPSAPGVLWSVNDSGSRALLYRLGTDGSALGRVRVDGVWVHDWETLAVWRDRDTDWILLGDVGDNRGVRRHVRVHAVREPGPADTRARVAWTLRFRFPDGPRDAEGIAVDHADDSLLVLTKREARPGLYRVPLSGAASDSRVREAQLLARVPAGILDGEATGLDLSKDGRWLAVMSYRGLYLWQREPGVAWSSVLALPPLEIPLPELRKAEAMAFSHDSRAILVGSEQLPAPLLTIALDRHRTSDPPSTHAPRG